MQIYYRIDQQELEKKGLAHKSELCKEQGGLKSLHQFSMLQRFRQSKDFKAPDRFKSKTVNFEEVKEKEGEWYRENAQTAQQKEK